MVFFFFWGNFLNSTRILNLKFNHLGPPKINGYLENIFLSLNTYYLIKI